MSSNGNKKLAYKLKEELLSWYGKDLSSLEDEKESILDILATKCEEDEDCRNRLDEYYR